MKTKYTFFALLFLVVGSMAFAVDLDGVLKDGEYSKEVVFDKGNFHLYWEFQGDKVFMAIVAKTPGWVAIGFEPTTVMANSDMIFGLVGEPGNVQAIDAWSTGMFGPHPPDVNQGGSSSILSFAGTRTGDTVVFEFSRLLNTGDKFDKVIPVSGNFKVIWAYGPNLQFTSKHSKAGSAVLKMEGSN